ncbi:MAG: hypothetical protein IPL39_07310 [Opitutaceae bacterium]|nr:hypothetical protein [Opitutaceae bacterium]
MTRPSPSLRARPRPIRPSKAIPGTATPMDPALLADVLGSTQSAWWEADRKQLARIAKLAAQNRVFAPCPRAPLDGGADEEIAPADQQRGAAFFAALPKATLPCSVDYRLTSGANLRWVRHSVLHRSATGPSARYTGVVTDITELKNLEAEILRISEREQNRIGQDLHDDLCQVLAGLSCLTRVLENRIAPQLPGEVPNLREINQQLVDAMGRTRALTHGLFPTAMRSTDMRPALLELAKQVEIRFGVTVRTAFRGRFPEHAAHEILQVYRIAQEAISNAIRHGRATRIAVALHRLSTGMQLSVRDNGTGFAAAQPLQHGIGLQIMHHRASQLGARIEIGNAPRCGALVLLHYQPVALL